MGVRCFRMVVVGGGSYRWRSPSRAWFIMVVVDSHRRWFMSMVVGGGSYWCLSRWFISVVDSSDRRWSTEVHINLGKSSRENVDIFVFLSKYEYMME